MINKPIHPFWGILEITVFSGLTFTGIWVFGPQIGTSPMLQLFFWVMVIAGGVYILWYSPFQIHQLSPETWGLRINGSPHPGSLKQAWRVYAVFTLVAVILLILYTILFSPESLFQVNFKGMIVKFAGYIFFGTVQSIIFFGFILTRLRIIITGYLGSKSTLQYKSFVVFFTATIFSLFHIPNIALMVCTLIAGICWAWIFYKRPNILLMGISHAILGTILHQVVQLHMRIGPFYNNPEFYILREVIPFVKELIGDLF